MGNWGAAAVNRTRHRILKKKPAIKEIGWSVVSVDDLMVGWSATRSGGGVRQQAITDDLTNRCHLRRVAVMEVRRALLLGRGGG